MLHELLSSKLDTASLEASHKKKKRGGAQPGSRLGTWGRVRGSHSYSSTYDCCSRTGRRQIWQELEQSQGGKSAGIPGGAGGPRVSLRVGELRLLQGGGSQVCSWG